jgi:hypothetical protein
MSGYCFNDWNDLAAREERQRIRQLESNRLSQQRQRERNREWHQKKKARQAEVQQLTLMLYPRPQLHQPSAVVYLPPAGSIARSFFGIVR